MQHFLFSFSPLPLLRRQMPKVGALWCTLLVGYLVFMTTGILLTAVLNGMMGLLEFLFSLKFI